MANFKPIDKSQIDFSNIYGNSTDAILGNTNTLNVNPQYWGDEGTLMLDENTGLITENGVGLGYINPTTIMQSTASAVVPDLASIQQQTAMPTIDPNLMNSSVGIQSVAAPQAMLDMTQLMANMAAAAANQTAMPTATPAVETTMTFPTEAEANPITPDYSQLFTADATSIQSVVPSPDYNQLLASMQAATLATDISAPVTQTVPELAQITGVDMGAINNQALGFGGSAVGGALSPGTIGTTYGATPYSLDPAARQELIALVYSEASERPDYLTSDTMGVTSTILNRLENGYGSTIHDVISRGAFSGYGNKKYRAAMANPGVVNPAMVAAVDSVLAGQRNTDALYFTGNGVYNKFRKNYR